MIIPNFVFTQMIIPLFLIFLNPIQIHNPKLWIISGLGPGIALAEDSTEDSAGSSYDSTSEPLSAEDEELFRHWTSKSLPLTADSRPVSVNVMLYLESLRDVSSEVTLDFYMIECWKDLRYVGMPRLTNKWRSPYNSVKIPGIASERFWYPDSYFYLVKAVSFDRNAQFMEIFNDGEITFNRKVSFPFSNLVSPKNHLFPQFISDK